MALAAMNRPLDTLWQAKAIIWIVLAGEAVALVLTLTPGLVGDRLVHFAIASLAIQWIALMSLGALYLCRRWLVNAGPLTIARSGLAALLLSTWLVCGLAWLSLRDLWLTPQGGWWAFTLQLTAIASTVGLLGLAAFQMQWRTTQLALRAKQAELDALQARIRPHFLFNTINTGIALVHARPEATERLLLDLSDLFRAALAGSGEVTLQEELSLARRYLEIEQLRFGDRLDVHWEIPESPGEMAEARLPTLSIQPLVENAIKHGVETNPGDCHVSVGLRVDASKATIIVRNRLPRAPSPSNGHGIGLTAVAARIQAFTQGKGHLQTRIEDGEYIAELSIPLHG